MGQNAREIRHSACSHVGVILVPASVKNEAFGVLIPGVQATLTDITQEEWIDRVQWFRRT